MTHVTVKLSDGKTYTKHFHIRSEADAWSDQTMRMGMQVIEIVSDDEPRDSEGAPLVTC